MILQQLCVGKRTEQNNVKVIIGKTDVLKVAHILNGDNPKTQQTILFHP